MALLARVVRELEKRKQAALSEAERIDQALAALRGMDTGRPKRHGRPRRRKMSAEARRKIATAQRRRWAKVRAHSTKGVGKKKLIQRSSKNN